MSHRFGLSLSATVVSIEEPKSKFYSETKVEIKIVSIDGEKKDHRTIDGDWIKVGSQIQIELMSPDQVKKCGVGNECKFNYSYTNGMGENGIVQSERWWIPPSSK